MDEEAGVWGDWRCFVEGVVGSEGRVGEVMVGKTGRELDWGMLVPMGASLAECGVAGLGREGVEVDVERYILSCKVSGDREC